jgi:AMP nucleosidase
MHAEAVQAQQAALRRFAAGGVPPGVKERQRFRYSELRLVRQPDGPIPVTRRAWGQIPNA